MRAIQHRRGNGRGRRDAAAGNLLHARGEGGLTIIELMVTMVLASIVTGGVFYMMSGQQKTYLTQSRIMSNQTNLWGGMMFMQREIQRAGFGIAGCPDGRVMMWDGIGGSGALTETPVVALAIYNDCNLLESDPLADCPDGSGSDSMTISYANDNAMGQMAGTRILETLSTTVRGAVNSELVVRQGHTFQATPGDEDFIVLWQTASSTQPCIVLRVTDVQPHATIPNADNLTYDEAVFPNPPDADNILPGGGFLAPGALAVRFRNNPASGPRHFSLDRSTNPPSLVTWRGYDQDPKDGRNNGTFEVIADGIEDMQLTFACDVDGDSALYEGKNAGYKTADEWTNNAQGDTIPVCGTQPIRVVRVSLVARSDGPEIGNKRGFRPALEDRPAGSPTEDLAVTDGLGTFNRKVLTTTVSVINLR